MAFKFLAQAQGGIGEDVWDREKQFSAVDFQDASNQAIAWAEELGGHVVELSQSYERAKDLKTDYDLAMEDKARLDCAAQYIGNIDLHIKPVPEVTISDPFICDGSNLRECLDKITTDMKAVELGMMKL